MNTAENIQTMDLLGISCLQTDEEISRCQTNEETGNSQTAVNKSAVDALHENLPKHNSIVGQAG